MARRIDAGAGDAFGIDDLAAALDAHGFDARDEDSLIDAGPLLARLGRNPRFLADLAIAALKDGCVDQGAINSYGAQALLLRPPGDRYVLRASFWPAMTDAAVRAGGPEAFFYGHAHDHNFPFLTYGYLGPGYVSDDYERDPDALIGVAGEAAGLTPMGRNRLDPGQLLLYRARRDVHRQAPPDAFSVSLNVLVHDPAQSWVDQYRFDVDRDIVLGGLTTAPSEALLAVAVHLADGLDLAERFARSHPFARMRVTALDAAMSRDRELGIALLERAADDPDRYVAAQARIRLTAAETDVVGM